MKKIFILLSFLVLISAAGLFIATARENNIKDNFRVAFVDASVKYRARVVERFYDSLGAKGILEVLEAEYPRCHFEAHELGKIVYKKTQDLTTSVELCEARCTGGCFHGALIEAFKDIVILPDSPQSHIGLTDLKNKMRAICSDETVAALHREGKCIHGVGHALAFLSEYVLEEAISYCKLLNDKPLEHYCAEGVFMEYIFRNNIPGIKKDSLHYPCDRYTEFPAACYRSQTQKIREELRELDKIGNECLKLKSLGRLGCFYGMGFAYSQEVIKEPHFLSSLCQYGEINDKRMCIEGAMEKPEKAGLSAAVEACNYVSDELRSFCVTAFHNKSYSLEKSFELYFKQ